MNRKAIVPLSFLFSLVLSVAGAFFTIVHREGAEAWLVAGFLASLVFIVSAIREVVNSKRIDRTEKITWTISFVFFSAIAGLIYLLLGRKRVVND